MRTGGVRYQIELDTLSYILHLVGKVRHKTNACGYNTKEIEKSSKTCGDGNGNQSLAQVGNWVTGLVNVMSALCFASAAIIL